MEKDSKTLKMTEARTKEQERGKRMIKVSFQIKANTRERGPSRLSTFDAVAQEDGRGAVGGCYDMC